MIKISLIKNSILVAIVVAIALWFSGESILQIPQRVDSQNVKPVQASTDLPVLGDSEFPYPDLKVPASKLVIYEHLEHHYKRSQAVVDISPIPVSAHFRERAFSNRSCRKGESLVREIRSVWSRDFFSVYDVSYARSSCYNLTAPVGYFKIVIDGKTYNSEPLTLQRQGGGAEVYFDKHPIPANLREALEKLSSEHVEIRLYNSDLFCESERLTGEPVVTVTLNPATVKLFKEIYRRK